MCGCLNSRLVGADASRYDEIKDAFELLAIRHSELTALSSELSVKIRLLHDDMKKLAFQIKEIEKIK